MKIIILQKQVRRYGFTAGLKISVLSNFEDLYIYDTSCPVEDTDLLTKSRIKAYHYTDFENSADELLRYLGKESVYSGNFKKEWQNITLNVEHTSIDKFTITQLCKNTDSGTYGDNTTAISNKKNFFLPKCLEIWNKYITFAA